jgi:hypothetical protein
MSNTDEYERLRVINQRIRRERQRIEYRHAVHSESDTDTDSTTSPINDIEDRLCADSNEPAAESFERENDSEVYHADQDDQVDETRCDSSECDNTPPLYFQSPVSIGEAIRRLMTFFVDANLDQQKVVTLLHLIKSLLPVPNSLPTTLKQVFKIFGKSPSCETKFYCNQCLTMATKRSAHYFCTNVACGFHDTRLPRRELTEIVSINIRQKIQSIVLRNFNLFSRHEELFPDSDITSGKRYLLKTKDVVHPITLNLHTDGAPLVRSTKSALWPCFATIAELPPPVREYQSNILTLGLWVSCIKPDVNLFLGDVIEQLMSLSTDGTSIFIHEHEFKVHVRTLFFISDLPAKALFMKTVNFNGYFACTSCLTKGMSKTIRVI